MFNAVADECRRRILASLARGECTVGQLTESLDLPQPQVSKHLRVLRDAGAVRCRTQGRHRVYRVDPTALRELHEWTRQFEALWNERYDRLDDLLHDEEFDVDTDSDDEKGPT